MNHFTTAGFWKLHDQLPEHIRQLAKKNYGTFEQAMNPEFWPE
jgi:hypothetical protein